MKQTTYKIYTFLIFIFLSINISANTLRIGVAANFKPAMNLIKPDFESKYNAKLVSIYASSGKLYSQIVHGAPFDIFLAADDVKTQALANQGLILDGSRQIYIRGQLGVWSRHKAVNSIESLKLNMRQANKIAIANPKLAPYGQAASQVIEQLGLNQIVKLKLVQGENISHAYQFVKTNNAELGFLSWSHLLADKDKLSDFIYLIPKQYYQPINQEMIIVKTTKHSDLAWAFHQYLQSEDVQARLVKLGYIARQVLN